MDLLEEEAWLISRDVVDSIVSNIILPMDCTNNQKPALEQTGILVTSTPDLPSKSGCLAPDIASEMAFFDLEAAWADIEDNFKTGSTRKKGRGDLRRQIVFSANTSVKQQSTGKSILNLPSALWLAGTTREKDCYITCGQPRALSWKDHPTKWEKLLVEKTYALEQQSKSGKTSGEDQREKKVERYSYHTIRVLVILRIPNALNFKIYVQMF